MEPVRILQVVPNMHQGGIENLIMNIYRNIDRNKVQFDFLVHYTKRCDFDDEIEKLGGKIYRFSIREDKNIFKYIKELKRFFKEHQEYKIVHGHMASLAYIYLKIAKKCGVKTRIVHSHGTGHLKSIKGYVKYFMFRFADKNANVRLACSTEAGRYLFGKKDFELIPNAIDVNRFKYNKKIRDEQRAKYNISDEEFVIGNIGRFNLQKNHEYIIKIFDDICKKDNKCKLLLVGTGELEEKIKRLVNELNLNSKVIFTGAIRNVEEVYQAMDIFVMPSLFEGLPVTGVEAQASGLTCLFSDTITREVILTKNCKYIDINEDVEQWSDEILSEKDKKYDRINNYYEVEKSNFNIITLSKKMEDKYINYLRKENK